MTANLDERRELRHLRRHRKKLLRDMRQDEYLQRRRREDITNIEDHGPGIFSSGTRDRFIIKVPTSLAREKGLIP